MADMEALERELVSLVQGNSPENRRKFALQAKSDGRKVIGLLCTYAPEEVIYAAGMLPWRVTGTWDSNLGKATVYRDMDSCRYCTHALEALLRGQMEFLDGVVDSDWDDDRRRVFDTWVYVSKPAFTATFTAPKSKSEIMERYFCREMAQIISSLEDFSGTRITNDRLWQAVKVYNKTRRLLLRLYELRKRAAPPVTGAEVLGIVTASTVMDKADFNNRLERLLPYIESRVLPHTRAEPRIMVSSDMLDNPRFIEIIEGEGCKVVMDDLDTGSRYFHRLVDENADDPVSAIAHRYCWRPADPVGFNWEEQIQQIIEWARDWRCDGVIELYESFSPARRWRAPFLVRELGRAAIPLTRIARGYDAGGAEQIKTRVGAFLEMLAKTPV
ncbi:MAG: 2-hydroxyacyl-CoA dehydratase [Chloroflexi bacterium]|nr:2-hydroxyacyl-CoA dehydratase [Chloroflexota bacterium]